VKRRDDTLGICKDLYNKSRAFEELISPDIDHRCVMSPMTQADDICELWQAQQAGNEGVILYCTVGACRRGRGSRAFLGHDPRVGFASLLRVPIQKDIPFHPTTRICA
jgi:hypothetical protein